MAKGRTTELSSVTALPSPLREMIAQHIGKEEKVLFCCYTTGKYKSTYAPYRHGKFYEALAITDTSRIYAKVTYPGFFSDTDDKPSEYGEATPLIKINKTAPAQVRVEHKLRYQRQGYIDEGDVVVKEGSDGVNRSVIGLTFYSWDLFVRYINILDHAIQQAKARIPRDASSDKVPDIADQLMKLAKLYQDKVITQEEYEAAKRKLLG